MHCCCQEARAAQKRRKGLARARSARVHSERGASVLAEAVAANGFKTNLLQRRVSCSCRRGDSSHLASQSTRMSLHLLWRSKRDQGLARAHNEKKSLRSPAGAEPERWIPTLPPDDAPITRGTLMATCVPRKAVARSDAQLH